MTAKKALLDLLLRAAAMNSQLLHHLHLRSLAPHEMERSLAAWLHQQEVVLETNREDGN